MALRAKLAEKAGFPADKALFEDGLVRLGNQSQPLGTLAGREGLWAEDSMDYGDLDKRYAQATFGAHFCEELGRASCRERVCQYVYISVVAVYLNKKEQSQLNNRKHREQKVILTNQTK